MTAISSIASANFARHKMELKLAETTTLTGSEGEALMYLVQTNSVNKLVEVMGNAISVAAQVLDPQTMGAVGELANSLLVDD
jgi:hypothetical protein